MMLLQTNLSCSSELHSFQVDWYHFGKKNVTSLSVSTFKKYVDANWCRKTVKTGLVSSQIYSYSIMDAMGKAKQAVVCYDLSCSISWPSVDLPGTNLNGGC